MPEDDALTATLERIAATAAGPDLSLGRILDALEERGYGPILLALSAFLILPTGMIPGLPQIVGAAEILVGAQLVVGRPRPWFPARLRSTRISAGLLQRSVARARPWARRLNRLLSARLAAVCVHPLALRLIGVGVIFAGLLLIPFGLVPLLPFAIGLTTLLLGLGLTARDGVVTLIGFAALAWAMAQIASRLL